MGGLVEGFYDIVWEKGLKELMDWVRDSKSSKEFQF